MVVKRAVSNQHSVLSTRSLTSNVSNVHYCGSLLASKVVVGFVEPVLARRREDV